MKPYNQIGPESQAQGSGPSGQIPYLQINGQERFEALKHDRHGRAVVCLQRLKPNATGTLRSACHFEFAAKHLPGVIALLQALRESEAGK